MAMLKNGAAPVASLAKQAVDCSQLAVASRAQTHLRLLNGANVLEEALEAIFVSKDTAWDLPTDGAKADSADAPVRRGLQIPTANTDRTQRITWQCANAWRFSWLRTTVPSDPAATAAVAQVLLRNHHSHRSKDGSSSTSGLSAALSWPAYLCKAPRKNRAIIRHELESCRYWYKLVSVHLHLEGEPGVIQARKELVGQ
jgi:hypothetical protein